MIILKGLAPVMDDVMAPAALLPAQGAPRLITCMPLLQIQVNHNHNAAICLLLSPATLESRLRILLQTPTLENTSLANNECPPTTTTALEMAVLAQTLGSELDLRPLVP